MFQFDQQYQRGRNAEQWLDRHFRQWFVISPASREQQRCGVDRIWRDRLRGTRLSVEYKADHTARSTGNAFIEVHSTDRAAGWALTSRADLLCYYVVGRAIYLANLATLRSALSGWIHTYEQREVHNDGYVAIGVLVPLRELQALSCYVQHTETDDVRDSQRTPAAAS